MSVRSACAICWPMSVTVSRPGRPGQAPGQAESEQRAFRGGDQGAGERSEGRFANPGAERGERHLRARRRLGDGVDGAAHQRRPRQRQGDGHGPGGQRTGAGRPPAGSIPTARRCRLPSARSTPRIRPPPPRRGTGPRRRRQARRCRPNTLSQRPPGHRLEDAADRQAPERSAGENRERSPRSRDGLGGGNARGDPRRTGEPGDSAKHHQHGDAVAGAADAGASVEQGAADQAGERAGARRAAGGLRPPPPRHAQRVPRPPPHQASRRRQALALRPTRAPARRPGTSQRVSRINASASAWPGRAVIRASAALGAERVQLLAPPPPILPGQPGGRLPQQPLDERRTSRDGGLSPSFPSRGATGCPRRAARSTSPSCDLAEHEAVAVARHGPDEDGLARVVAQRAAQRADGLRERAVRDDDVAPDFVEDLAAGHTARPPLDQQDEQIEVARNQRQRARPTATPGAAAATRRSRQSDIPERAPPGAIVHRRPARAGVSAAVRAGRPSPHPTGGHPAEARRSSMRAVGPASVRGRLVNRTSGTRHTKMSPRNRSTKESIAAWALHRTKSRRAGQPRRLEVARLPLPTRRRCPAARARRRCGWTR